MFINFSSANYAKNTTTSQMILVYQSFFSAFEFSLAENYLSWNNKSAIFIWTLPVFGDQFQPSQRPGETAFSVPLQSYHLPPLATKGKTALGEFMLHPKPQIDLLIEPHFSKISPEVQFCAYQHLGKSSQKEDKEDVVFEIYAIFVMTIVNGQGLSNILS